MAFALRYAAFSALLYDYYHRELPAIVSKLNRLLVLMVQDDINV